MERIGDMATSYYQNLFTSSNLSLHDIDSVCSCINPSVSSVNREKLDRIFTREEIVQAIKSMHPRKTPRPDGILAIFCKKYWEVLEGDLIDICLDALNNDATLNECD